MHAIIAAIVAVLLSVPLLKLARKRRLLGALGGAAATLQMVALALGIVGLLLIVLGWIGVVDLTWGVWLVWAGLFVYLATAVMRATRRVVGGQRLMPPQAPSFWRGRRGSFNFLASFGKNGRPIPSG